MNPKQPRTPCKACGKDPARPSYGYCSNRCQREHELTGWIKEWVYGASTLSSRIVKRILIRFYGEKCSSCSWAERNPVSGKVPVEMEHRDGNYRNNHYSNVCLLCPNCHSLTPTFRALNWGNGRESRRKASVAQSAQQVTCNHPFTSSTLVAGSNLFKEFYMTSEADPRRASHEGE